MEAACKDSARVACWSRPGRGVCRCETHQGYRGWVNRRLAYNKVHVGNSSMKECFRRRAAVPLHLPTPFASQSLAMHACVLGLLCVEPFPASGSGKGNMSW